LIGKAYLDIETAYSGEITVVGLFRPPSDLIQITHPGIDSGALLGALDGVDEILTFWGHRFDLPMINRWLGLNLRETFRSTDLADHCHRHGLYGGLKVVERILGIERRTAGLDGADAMRLWEEWRRGDRRSLKKLLLYNEDDVVNLYLLEKELHRLDFEGTCP